MLTLRNAQVAAFSVAARKRLEELMVAHLQDCFQVDYQLMGDKQARVFIRDGIARASGYGLERHGEICRFIDLSLALGSHFDRDPLLPWAAAALRDEVGQRKNKRMERLDEQALEWIGEGLGEEGEHFLRGVARASTLSYESYDPDGEDFEAALTRLMTRLNSAKYHAIAPECWPPFFQLLERSAEEFRIQDQPGCMLLGALMFMLGAHILEDPVHPWVRKALEKFDPNDKPDAQGRRLYQRARLFIDEALALLRAQGAADEYGQP